MLAMDFRQKIIHFLKIYFLTLLKSITMKNFIFSLITLCIISLMTTNSIAASISEYNSDPVPTSQQFKKYLQNIDISDLEGTKTVMVQFIINENSEILVLSTNDEYFDNQIKSHLNYKKIENQELKINMPYWLPVTFKQNY